MGKIKIISKKINKEKCECIYYMKQIVGHMFELFIIYTLLHNHIILYNLTKTSHYYF